MLKRSVVTATIACALALATFSPVHATTWEFDPVHTNVQFSVRHMTITNVRGEFTKVSGKILSEGKDPNRIQIEASIDASSIDTRAPKRDKHLKSADFLDVEHYPTIMFKSRKAEPVAPGKWKLTGDLTIRGITKEVVLDVEGPSEEVKDPKGNIRVGAHATTTINRKDFGLKWNMTLEGGGMLVGDNVAVAIDVEAVRQAESPTAAVSSR